MVDIFTLVSPPVDIPMLASNRTTIEQTKEFLRKITHSEIGLYIYEKGNILDVNIGGIKESKQVNIPVAASIGISTGGLTSVNISTMPVYHSFSSYTKSRAVFIKCLFDNKSLNHIKEKTFTNVFDKISMKSRYLKNTVLKKKLKLETIFRQENYFVYGYYNKKEKTYNLLKFDE